MALTRDFKETIRKRLKRDPEFKKALARESLVSTERKGPTRYSAEQIKEKIAHGEDRTNWSRANAVTGNTLEASIKTDSDETEEEPDWAQAFKSGDIDK
jgi:hypothetical protein